jgi:7-cyano-7-deazaguanine synthase
MDYRIVHIFWTGGLDSTYRVVELLRQNCVIQPHYITLTGRGTVEYELRAISEITAILNSDKRTKAKILPVVIFPMSELEEYADIQSAWELLHETKYFNSTQYPLLARYARQKKLKLEMGIQFSENGSVAEVVDESYLTDYPDRDDVMMIDPVKGAQEWASLTLFQDFLFPKSLYHKTKKEEIEELKSQGYGKVLKKVWTCFHPVLGMPCGHCFPCQSAMKEGAGMMVPFTGYILGGIRLYYGKIPRFSKRIVRRILPQKVYEMLRNIFIR